MNFSSEATPPAGATEQRPDMPVPTLGGRTCPEVAAPLLSFIVVNWNYDRFIGQTLDSIRAQDYSPFECIIIDNDSSDDSLAVIARHIGSDDRFRVIVLPRNRGQLGGVFVGLREAAGAFFAIIDADDVLLPDFASVHIQVHLSVRATVAITSNNIIEVDHLNRAFSSSYPGLRAGPTGAGNALRDEAIVVRLPTVSSDFYNAQLMRHVSLIPRDVGGWLWSPGTSNVIRRSVAAQFVVASDAPTTRGSDNYFLKLCHALAGTAAIDMPLSTRRIHDSNDYARRESIPGLQNGSPEITRTMKVRAIENLETVLRNAAFHRWQLGLEFWRVLDQLLEIHGAPRRTHYRDDAIVAAFRRAAASLVEGFGVLEFIDNIRLRFGLRDSEAILREVFRGPIPLRYYLRLLPRPR